eukprot:631186-Hanusia_phi.AAC.1
MLPQGSDSSARAVFIPGNLSSTERRWDGLPRPHPQRHAARVVWITVAAHREPPADLWPGFRV